MKPLRFCLAAIILLAAAWFGDRLASSHTWWVFDVPHRGERPSARPFPWENLGYPELTDPGCEVEPVLKKNREAERELATPSLKPVATASKQRFAEVSGGNPGPGMETFPGPIAVIHGKRILRIEDGRPAPGELERLRMAIAAVGLKFDAPILIIDADGLALSSTPVVLYEDERYDITPLILTEMNRAQDLSR